MQTQNITELMKNYTFLIEDQIDITFIQECKIRDEEQGKIKNLFSEEKYELIVVPCCKDTKKAECRSRMRQQGRKFKCHNSDASDEGL